MHVGSTTDLWQELGAGMRLLRTTAGKSLRDVEQASGWGRGTLSQAENGKAHPSLPLVSWYDEAFDGDGVLLATYAEARLAGQTPPPRRRPAPAPMSGDAVRVDAAFPDLGALVRPGAQVRIGWDITNVGQVPWRRRRVQRLGATASPRLITGPSSCELDDCDPGQTVEVRLTVTAPRHPSTAVAYWDLVDELSRPCCPSPPLFVAFTVVPDGATR